jgi:hypothetical protein
MINHGEKEAVNKAKIQTRGFQFSFTLNKMELMASRL